MSVHRAPNGRFSACNFHPLNSLPPTTICFDLVFESFLLLRCFSCPLGRAASASLASSSGVSVSCGSRGFLVRVAWSVPVPGELSCCGVCGGLRCLGGLLACAFGVSVFGSVVPGVLLLARVPACAGGLRSWPRWFVRALPWRLLSGRFCRCVPCRLAFGFWWFACPGALRLAGRLGSLRCVLAVVCRWGLRAAGASLAPALVAAVCAGRSGVAVACVPLTGDRRWGSLGWLVHRHLRFPSHSPSVLPTVAGLDDPPLRRSCVAALAFYPNPFAFTLARLSHTGRGPISLP